MLPKSSASPKISFANHADVTRSLQKESSTLVSKVSDTSPSSFVSSKLFNYLWSSHTDLSIGAPIAGTPLAALILFLSFAEKPIHTPTHHQHTDE
jgi:hypothetical protein